MTPYLLPLHVFPYAPIVDPITAHKTVLVCMGCPSDLIRQLFPLQFCSIILHNKRCHNYFWGKKKKEKKKDFYLLE